MQTGAHLGSVVVVVALVVVTIVVVACVVVVTASFFWVGFLMVLLQSVNTIGRPVHVSYHPSKKFRTFMQDTVQYLHCVYFMALLLQE